jgi:NADPH:quinone reductase-like Zn-dependent oxidoreductase
MPSSLQRRAQIPDNLTFDQAATIPLALATAALGLYNKKQQPHGGLALYPPWEEGGRGKYSGQPILVIGGSSAVGQQGMLSWHLHHPDVANRIL